jgi:hypothetical protein
MDSWDSWEKLLVGVAVLALLLYMGPRLKGSFGASRSATSQDWMSLLWPIIAVIAFVALLISSVR